MSRRLSNSARAPSWDRLKVVEMAIAELSPAPKHARKHPASQIRSLAQSIESFGFNAPALVDETNRLLSGHARVEAEKRAFTLADNRLAEQARWDDALLAENFQILDSLDLAFPLEATGFETTEIDRLLGFEIVDEVDAADAPIPLADGPAIAKPGDLWQLGPHRLYCGDALDQCSYAMLMGDDRARMILTDPPYNLAAQEIGRGAARRHGDFVSGAGELDDAGFVEFLAAMFGHARRTAVDGALAYVFMDWRHAWHALTAGRRAFDALKNVCIWDKGSGGMGSLYRSQHELVLVFKAGRAAHVNNIELGRHGRNRSNVWRHAGANGFAGLIEDTSRAETLAIHPTVKPVKLLAETILDVSRRDEIVLDPFLGAGSTLMAAERVGRRCFGIALDPRYADATLRRWCAYTGEEPIHAPSGLSFGACERRSADSAGEISEREAGS